MARADGVAISPWTQRRRRAAELTERWPFAAELLKFYAALLEVQEERWAQARIDMPTRSYVASYTGANVLRKIVDVTMAHGPVKLAGSVAEMFHEFNFEERAETWLRGDALAPVDRYLVRASVGPVLEAISIASVSALGASSNTTRRESSNVARGEAHGDRRCPSCGGLPQLSYFATSAEDLVTPQRFLECERCATSWTYPRMTCASCGETKTELQSIFGEQGTLQAELAGRVIRQHGASQNGTSQDGASQNGTSQDGASQNNTPQKDGAAQATAAQEAPRFRHLRIDACSACSHYLLTIDLGRDPQAVPVVDELAAIPLDLYAKEHGLTKIVPNLMGF